MQFNVERREISLKLVFYGPPLSGKTTNLQVLHRFLQPDQRGELTVLNTADDRTLFFDLLPVVVDAGSGYRIRLKLYTVPGQVVHAATRRVVLGGADAVLFVADSRRSCAKSNNEFWHGMRRYLRESGHEPDELPTVIQFNKRDLPDIRTDEELEKIVVRGSEPLYKAVAVRGEGVVESLYGLLELLFARLDARYGLEQRFGISRTSFFAAIFGDFEPDAAAQVLASGVHA